MKLFINFLFKILHYFFSVDPFVGCYSVVTVGGPDEGYINHCMQQICGCSGDPVNNLFEGKNLQSTIYMILLETVKFLIIIQLIVLP